MTIIRMLSGARVPATVLGVAIFLAACDVKDWEFFTVVGSGTGEIVAYVDGTPQGAMVRLSGEGVDVSGLADEEGHLFGGLSLGSYAVTVAPPAGYSCSPTTVSVAVTEAVPEREAVFSCLPQSGMVLFTSSGLSGASTFPMTLMGGVDLVGSFGSSGVSFSGVQPGDWSWELGLTSGYECSPNFGDFTLAPGATFTQAIECSALLGTLSVMVTGTGSPVTVTYAGPESGSVQAGTTPAIRMVMPGQYSLALTSPAGYTCETGKQAEVSAGGTANVVFECLAQPGTVTVTQSGAPNADVVYAGPSGGSVSTADGASVPVSGLAAGNYTFTIADPTGYTCSPSSVPVTLAPGGTSVVSFTCVPSVVQPMTATFAIGDIQGSPGGVAAGTYLVGLLDNAASVGSSSITAVGGNTFIGFSPTRLGLGSGGSFTIPLTGLTVGGSPFAPAFLQFCSVNGAISAGQPFSARYLDGTMSNVGQLDLTSSSGCVEGAIPAGAESVRFQWTFGGFIDFNGIRLRRN